MNSIPHTDTNLVSDIYSAGNRNGVTHMWKQTDWHICKWGHTQGIMQAHTDHTHNIQRCSCPLIPSHVCGYVCLWVGHQCSPASSSSADCLDILYWAGTSSYPQSHITDDYTRAHLARLRGVSHSRDLKFLGKPQILGIPSGKNSQTYKNKAESRTQVLHQIWTAGYKLFFMS